MSNESNPYAAFGVHNAVISGDTIEEHRQTMMAHDVAVRIGDDSVDLVDPDAGVEVIDKGEVTEEEEEGRITININTEGDNETEEVVKEDGEDEPQVDDVLEGEFERLADPDEELVKAVADISQHSDGFAEMRNNAVAQGLPQDVANRIETEYEDDGVLSEDSYEQLAKAGYSKAFVNSYIQGQEAIASTYVAKIVQYAGGEQKFNAIVAHIKATNPESLDTLYEAIERQDLKAIKSTINLATSGRQAKLGKAPARNVAARAPASGAVKNNATAPQGFKSAEEMVTAMGDPRYGRDAKYREEVRAKVALMS